MIRRVIALSLALLAGACAAKAPQAPPPQPQPTTASIPPPPPRGEPSPYFNMAATRLQATLGKPAFVRKDGVTEMWRYDGTTCRAFFFLYGSPLTVRHVETLPHGAESAADTGCLAALQASPAKTS